MCVALCVRASSFFACSMSRRRCSFSFSSLSPSLSLPLSLPLPLEQLLPSLSCPAAAPLPWIPSTPSLPPSAPSSVCVCASRLQAWFLTLQISPGRSHLYVLSPKCAERDDMALMALTYMCVMALTYMCVMALTYTCVMAITYVRAYVCEALTYMRGEG